MEDYIAKLKDLGCNLTLESDGDIFACLGINFQHLENEILLTQTGIVNKVISYTGMDQTSSKAMSTENRTISLVFRHESRTPAHS